MIVMEFGLLQPHQLNHLMALQTEVARSTTTSSRTRSSTPSLALLIIPTLDSLILSSSSTHSSAMLIVRLRMIHSSALRSRRDLRNPLPLLQEIHQACTIHLVDLRSASARVFPSEDPCWPTLVVLAILSEEEAAVVSTVAFTGQQGPKANGSLRAQ